jgi:uncharacterized membrane protein YeaQ/YmgE (transglycosylase-associated protein family)
MLWTIVTTIIGGIVIGVLARLVLPGRQPIGFLWTVLLGIAGSLIGSWATWKFTSYHNENGGIEWIPFFVGILVAALLIAAYVAVSKRGAGSGRRV